MPASPQTSRDGASVVLMLCEEYFGAKTGVLDHSSERTRRCELEAWSFDLGEAILRCSATASGFSRWHQVMRTTDESAFQRISDVSWRLVLRIVCRSAEHIDGFSQSA